MRQGPPPEGRVVSKTWTAPCRICKQPVKWWEYGNGRWMDAHRSRFGRHLCPGPPEQEEETSPPS
jgi:hypothetical protein